MKKTKFKQTEIGRIPEDWGIQYLKKVLKKGGYIRGPFGSALRRNELRKEGIPIYEQLHAIYNRRDFRFFIDKGKFDGMKRFQVQENDLIISCSGTLGEVSIISARDPKGIISQALLLLRPDKKHIKPKYLKYFFTSKQGRNSLISRSSGSVQVNISKRQIIENILLPLPNLFEQDKIVKVISDFDSKIEVNRKMNEILEELGRTLFKRWFVDFEFPNEKGKPYKSSGGRMVESEFGEIPEGWKVEEFDSLFELTMGLSPKGESYNSDREGIPLLNGAADFNEEVIYPTKYTTQPTRVNKERDLIFCIRGTIGNIVLADKQYCLGRGVAAITSKSENFDEFIYFKLHEKIEELIQNASGSVIIGLSKEDIAKQKVICAPLKIIETFHKQMKTIFSKKRLNSQDKDNLIQIRDALLPKLMSGKIRVKL